MQAKVTKGSQWIPEKGASLIVSAFRKLKILIARRNRGQEHIVQQLKDYVEGGTRLFWMRQSMFFSISLLTAHFYDPVLAIFCLLLNEVAEAIDYSVSKKILEWNTGGVVKARKYIRVLMADTLVSATAVSLFSVLLAQYEGVGYHFAPLFLLFGAALFAAMNNHQLLRILILRLSVYGVAFLYIPIRDLMIIRPPLDNYLWLQFATCLFVVYFIVDCSIIFLRKYQNGLVQLGELTQERDRAKAAYETKSQFVSTVSHELRTPLTSIKGGLDLIQSGTLGELPEECQKIFAIAVKNSNRLALLIDDLLDMQKLTAGQMNYRLANLDISILMQDSVDANEGYGKAKNVSFELTCPPEGLVIHGDQDRLMQVMANVLSNAVKFSDQNSVVKIRVDNRYDKVRIMVQDTGVGIPEGSYDKVFGRFTQVDSQDQRKAGGSGLGLNIAQQIVEGHQGEINYASEVGIGTTFYIDFDLVSPVSEAGDNETQDSLDPVRSV